MGWNWITYIKEFIEVVNLCYTQFPFAFVYTDAILPKAFSFTLLFSDISLLSIFLTKSYSIF